MKYHDTLQEILETLVMGFAIFGCVLIMLSPLLPHN